MGAALGGAERAGTTAGSAWRLRLALDIAELADSFQFAPALGQAVHSTEDHHAVQLGLRGVAQVALGLEQLEAFDGRPVEAFSVPEAHIAELPRYLIVVGERIAEVPLADVLRVGGVPERELALTTGVALLTRGVADLLPAPRGDGHALVAVLASALGAQDSALSNLLDASVGMDGVAAAMVQLTEAIHVPAWFAVKTEL